MDAPIVKATLMAAIMTGVSDFVGQTLSCYGANKPLTYDFAEVAYFMLYAVLTTPLNFMWQVWLEAQFPGYTEKLDAHSKEKLVDEVTTGHSNDSDVNEKSGLRNRAMTSESTPKSPAASSAKSLNLANLGKKFVIDNTFGMGFNNVLYLFGMPIMQGQSFAAANRNLQKQFWPLTIASQKLWPAVSVLSFTLIPVEYRTAFGGMVGFFWGIYISMTTKPERV